MHHFPDTEYGYDEYGNETEAEEHVADTLELTEYDEEGNEIEEEEQEESITTDITTSEYDDCGNAVETTSVSGDVETEERNTYDAMGRVLKEVTEDAESCIQKLKFRPGALTFKSGTSNGRYRNIYHVEMFIGYTLSGFDSMGTPYLGTRWAARKDNYAYGQVWAQL